MVRHFGTHLIKMEICLLDLFAIKENIITDYNKLNRTFPSNLIGIVCGYKKRTYFDGKNMDDDITNDFKL